MKALEIKCLRSLVGVSRMDRVINKVVCWRAGIEGWFCSVSIEMVWTCEKNG